MNKKNLEEIENIEINEDSEFINNETENDENVFKYVNISENDIFNKDQIIEFLNLVNILLKKNKELISLIKCYEERNEVQDDIIKVLKERVDYLMSYIEKQHKELISQYQNFNNLSVYYNKLYKENQRYEFFFKQLHHYIMKLESKTKNKG